MFEFHTITKPLAFLTYLACTIMVRPPPRLRRFEGKPVCSDKPVCPDKPVCTDKPVCPDKPVCTVMIRWPMG